MKHTPGPWTDGKDVYWAAKYTEKMNLNLVHSGAEHPDAEGNVRLIAAAPELLEALKVLLDVSERHIFGDECRAERDAARAAIAKAEGA